MKVKMTSQGSPLDEHWRQHIDRQRASGLTKGAYCRKHKMKDHALDYWITKLAASSPKSRFVAVEVKEAASAQQSTRGAMAGVMRIVLPDGTRIESQDGDMSSLVQLAALMRGRVSP